MTNYDILFNSDSRKQLDDLIYKDLKNKFSNVLNEIKTNLTNIKYSTTDIKNLIKKIVDEYIKYSALTGEIFTDATEEKINFLGNKQIKTVYLKLYENKTKYNYSLRDLIWMTLVSLKNISISLNKKYYINPRLLKLTNEDLQKISGVKTGKNDIMKVLPFAAAGIIAIMAFS